MPYVQNQMEATVPERQRAPSGNPEVERLREITHNPNSTPEQIKAAKKSLQRMAQEGARIRKSAAAYRRASRGW